ncbi:MAG: hypothetical protein AB2L26_10545 [Ignavibacteria bacterium]
MPENSFWLILMLRESICFQLGGNLPIRPTSFSVRFFRRESGISEVLIFPVSEPVELPLFPEIFFFLRESSSPFREAIFVSTEVLTFGTVILGAFNFGVVIFGVVTSLPVVPSSVGGSGGLLGSSTFWFI